MWDYRLQGMACGRLILALSVCLSGIYSRGALTRVSLELTYILWLVPTDERLYWSIRTGHRGNNWIASVVDNDCHWSQSWAVMSRSFRLANQFFLFPHRHRCSWCRPRLCSCHRWSPFHVHSPRLSVRSCNSLLVPAIRLMSSARRGLYVGL